jgi:hypothetical protein
MAKNPARASARMVSRHVDHRAGKPWRRTTRGRRWRVGVVKVLVVLDASPRDVCTARR